MASIINKFKPIDKPKFEIIPNSSYLTILPGDPSQIDSSARYFSYEKHVSTKVASVINEID